MTCAISILTKNHKFPKLNLSCIFNSSWY